MWYNGLRGNPLIPLPLSKIDGLLVLFYLLREKL
ncbi:hypothetical protein [Klebsiella phage vB_KpnM_TU02]|nr:hypothetical protein [Klebsiella phage vB_KpnM_TU02]